LDRGRRRMEEWKRPVASLVSDGAILIKKKDERGSGVWPFPLLAKVCMFFEKKNLITVIN